MILAPPIDRYLTRHPYFSVGVYGALIAVLCLTTLLLLADVVEQYRARNAALDALAQLNGRVQASSLKSGTTNESWPPGSPFLEGQTVTIASAALLQRITTAITRFGGTIVSSEIEPQKPQSKDGYITAVATCEIEQAALQQLLYDIEAGMPFLFVEQLAVETPSLPTEGERMRVRLGISGLWPSAK
jgi:general secretion pathway protein M